MNGLQDAARAAGLWNLCVRDPAWAASLGFVDDTPLAELMGPDRLAQEATNCAAPTNINADALIAYGSDAQVADVRACDFDLRTDSP